MAVSSTGLKSDCSGNHKIINPQLSEGNFKEKEKLVASPRRVPDPGQTGLFVVN
jgi:hypothetical protein